MYQTLKVTCAALWYSGVNSGIERKEKETAIDGMKTQEEMELISYKEARLSEGYTFNKGEKYYRLEEKCGILQGHNEGNSGGRVSSDERSPGSSIVWARWEDVVDIRRLVTAGS